MDLRHALDGWAIEHRLDTASMRRLEALAGVGGEPAALRRRLVPGLAVLAAALGGLGLVFWIAANWPTLGRLGRFALLQAVVLAMALAAAQRPALRAPAALLALLATGALLALFGQTYQTGADPWQLFAVWAALVLPLCLGVRSDVCWTPWALVAMTAVSLWLHAHTGQRWRLVAADAPLHAAAWAVAIALVVALGAAARRWTGAGAWSLRTAATLAVALVTFTGVAAVFAPGGGLFFAAAVAVLAAGAWHFAGARAFDVYALSAAALGLNVIIVAALARWLFAGAHGTSLGRLLLLGGAAAALLSASVHAVMRIARARAGPPPARRPGPDEQEAGR